MNRLLWGIQVLLAVIFLFSGWQKVSLPLDVLTKQFPLPGSFLRSLGVVELAGAIGLIVPWATGVRPGLTPLAAAGLVIIMIGATVLSVIWGAGVLALVPLVVGLLAAFVAHGRRRFVPATARRVMS